MVTLRHVAFLAVSTSTGFVVGLRISRRWERRRQAREVTCCGETGYADYAAVPCANPHCPKKR